MKHIITFIILCAGMAYSGYSQTNLICNPSFETINEDVFDKLNQCNTYYISHFPVDPNQDGLFTCWYTNTSINSGQGTGANDLIGPSYGIVPGLFQVTNHELQLFEVPTYIPQLSGGEENVDYTTTPARVLDDTDGNPSHLSLSTNSANSNEYGLDLSPPNSKFGENVSAVDGSNYLALLDVENEFNGKPFVITELKYPLVKDVRYTFLMYYAKMNLLGHLKETDDWGKVKTGYLNVWVCNSSLNDKQRIFRVKVENNEWSIESNLNANFVANKASTHLLIEFDPFSEGISYINTKIGGVFIDNLKLFESCETPLNQCDNANYRRDLLDVKLQKVELTSPYVNPSPGDNGPGIMKTIRAYHLENVKRFEMKIYRKIVDILILVRTIDMWYPHTEYYWDGKNDIGEAMPDGDYRAVINAVSNDCFHITDADEKDFKLKRDYSLFNVQIGNGLEDLNARIWGLNKVKAFTFEVFTVGGQSPIFSNTYSNPRSIIGLSIESLEALAGNQTITEGQYVIKVTVNNNCNQESVFSGSAHIGHQIPNNTDPVYLALYDYASVPKGIFECPYDFHYNQNVLSPMNCCEGDLYLQDMDIWNSWGTINIENNIYIGPNVIFENGTYNYLNAGKGFVFYPDQQTGVTVLGEAIFKPDEFQCDICKSYQVTVIDDEEVDEEDSEREIISIMNDSIDVLESKEMVLFPNPVSNDREITLKAGDKPINTDNYKLVLSNSVGVDIPIKVIEVSDRLIKFKPTSFISSGVYYLYYESNGIQQTFSLVIR